MIKICEYCGKEFETKYSRKIYCDNPHYRRCSICGKEFEITSNYMMNKPTICCSNTCRSIARKYTSIAKYGCSSPGNNVEARLKAKNTMRRKYNVDYPLQSLEIKRKAAESFHRTIWDRKYRNILPQDISCKDMGVFILKEKFAEDFIRKYHKELLIPAKLYVGLIKDNILYRCISFNPYENYRLVILQDCALPQYNVIDGDNKIFHELAVNYEITEIGRCI